MTDYKKLVKALRIRSRNLCPGDICDRCEAIHFLCSDKVMHDAAAAIEELEKALIEENEAEDDMYRLVCEKQSKIEELQDEVAELKRLKMHCADCSNCEILGHGHWIPQVTEDGGHNDLLDCSLCGESIWNTQKNKKFCPNCGAKMEVQ